jgi:signal transduction histidine kinase
VTDAVSALTVGDVPDELRAPLAAAAEQLELARSDLSRFAAGLGPADLESRGFEAALRSLAGVGPIPVQIDVDEDALPHDVALTAYFVCAEAITNAWKHADAAVILVSAHRVGDRLELVILDDGHGGARFGTGSGLDSLIDRVTAADGTIAVESPQGRGTRLTVELPIREPDGLADPRRSQSPTRTHGRPKT